MKDGHEIMSNKKEGSRFENELCDTLSNNDIWAHNFTQNHSGQPVDIIAVKNEKAYLIEAKVCSKSYFLFSRIEENQHYAIKYWEKCGNGECYFAIKFDDMIYMIRYTSLMIFKHAYNFKRISKEYISKIGVTLEEWIRGVIK